MNGLKYCLQLLKIMNLQKNFLADETGPDDLLTPDKTMNIKREAYHDGKNVKKE